MKMFDLQALSAFPYEQRDKNVLYHGESFKTRIIELKEGEKLPPGEPCVMETYVIFYIVSGRIGLNINNEYAEAGKYQCIISEPANYQMKALEHSKILGIQIQKPGQ